MRRAVAIATVAALAAGCAAAPRTARSPAPPVAGAAPLYGIVQDRAGRFVACAPCPGPTPKTPAAAAPRRPLAAGRPSLPARREPRRAQARPEQNRKKAVVVTAKRTDASFGPQPFHVVQFAFGKHEVPARERRRLVELAAQIEGRVLVTGYTDDIGPKAYNDWLARSRACWPRPASIPAASRSAARASAATSRPTRPARAGRATAARSCASRPSGTAPRPEEREEVNR